MDIALTALLVASKAEETFKKIRAILSAAFIELNPSFAGSDVDVNVSFWKYAIITSKDCRRSPEKDNSV